MRLAAVLIAALGFGGVATAAPPPPTVYPADYPKTLDGFDLPQVYAAYYSWVTRGREAALDKAIADKASWEGRNFWSFVATSQIEDYDYGIVRKDVFDRYCKGAPWKGEAATECAYRYRFAFIPGSFYEGSSIAALINKSFRPARLVKALSEAGIKPGAKTDFWSDPSVRQVFARHTDLATLYAPLVEHHDIGSTQCPALAAFVQKLGDLNVSLPPRDVLDGIDQPPPPHGAETRIRVRGRIPGGGTVTVEGTRSLYPLFSPLWAEVETCSPPSYKRDRASG